MPSTCHSLHWMSIRTTSFVHIIFRRLNEPVQSLETLSNGIQRWPVHHFRSVASPLAIRFPPNGIHHALKAHLKYSSLSSLIYFSFLSLSSLDLDAITNSFRTKYYPHFMLATFTTSNAMAVPFFFSFVAALDLLYSESELKHFFLLNVSICLYEMSITNPVIFKCVKPEQKREKET